VLHLRTLVGLLLVPALLVVGASGRVYALFECSMTGQTQPHCCCAAEQSEPCGDQIERADCCSERSVHVEATRGDLAAPVMPAVASAWSVRIPVRDLVFVVQSAGTFAPREAPRAIGPPLIVLYRVLRL
jgi:hypothetical protein